MKMLNDEVREVLDELFMYCNSHENCDECPYQFFTDCKVAFIIEYLRDSEEE